VAREESLARNARIGRAFAPRRHNGRTIEGHGCAAILDLRVRDGKRQSVLRSYTIPGMDRPNLTVLTHALVIRMTPHCGTFAEGDGMDDALAHDAVADEWVGGAGVSGRNS
jgi:hypothetical protein